MNDAGAGMLAARVSAWWLRPWTWMLAALLASGLAYAWARVGATTETAPEDLVQVNLLAFGVLAALLAVWRRCAFTKAPSLDDLSAPLRARFVLLLAAALATAAVAISALLIIKLGRPDLPGDVEGTVFLWLLSAPWCAAAAWVLFQRAKDGAPLGERFETAVLVTCGAAVALLGSWALYWGPEWPEAWDSLRLFLAVLAGFAFLAAPLVAAPPRWRRVGVSLLLLFHLGAVCAAVIGAPPGPWIVAQAHHRVFRNYLNFMYLNNAYRFYAPDPSPASQLWFRIEYQRPNTPLKEVRWVKLPDIDQVGHQNYPFSLQYTRRLCLTENVARTEPM